MQQSIDDAEIKKAYTTMTVTPKPAADWLEEAFRARPEEDKRKPLAVMAMETPKGAYFEMVEKGAGNAKLSAMKTLHAAIMGGGYVGIAGMLSLSVAGNIPGAVGLVGPGVQKMLFAALFPMNLLLILNSGAQLFTGNSMVLPAAVYEGKAHWGQVLRSWTLSALGNFIGCVGCALLLKWSGLLVAGTKEMAISTAMRKSTIPFWKAFARGVCCNWLVCLGVYMGTQAKDLGGRMVGIWYPISTFVAIGFEHSVANMFLMPLGMFAGAALSWKTMFYSNLLPVILGNALAGAVIVALGFSFQFGRVGQWIK